MADGIVYVAMPAYELAALTGGQADQIVDRLPHNSAAAFTLARREAVLYFERGRPQDAWPADDCDICQTTAGCRCNSD